MVFELEALVIGVTAGLLGGIISVGLRAYLRTEHMEREFVWKRKVEVYDTVLRDLFYLKLIVGQVLGMEKRFLEWKEEEEGVEREDVKYRIRVYGYLVGGLDVLESFVWSEFPNLRNEFGEVRDDLGSWRDVKGRTAEELRRRVHKLMQRVGLACWGRMMNALWPLELLMEEGSELSRVVGEAHLVWHEIQQEPQLFDKKQVMEFERGFMEDVRRAMKVDLEGTLKK